MVDSEDGFEAPRVGYGPHGRAGVFLHSASAAPCRASEQLRPRVASADRCGTLPITAIAKEARWPQVSAIFRAQIRVIELDAEQGRPPFRHHAAIPLSSPL